MAYESRLSITIDSRTAEQRAEDMQKSLELLERAGVRLTNTNSKVSSSSKNAGSAMGEAGSKAKNGASGVDRINKSLKETDSAAASAAATMRRTLIGAFAGISTMQIIDIADQWGQYDTRIRGAIRSTEEYTYVNERLLQSSADTFRSINETKESFINLSPVLRDMGLTLSQSIDAVDAFSGLLVVNGANAERGAAAIQALAKSMQKGKVDADAWITIYSTADTIVDSLAKSTGKSAQELRKLGAEGKITGAELAKALAEDYGRIIEQVEKMPTTVRDAFTKMNNTISEYVGQQNKAYGITAKMVDGINGLSNNFDTLVTMVGVTAVAAFSRYAGVLTSNTIETIRNAVSKERERMAAVAAAEAELRLATAKRASVLTAGQAIVADQRLAAARTNLAAVTNQATIATRAFNGAMSLVGGPAGLVFLGAAALTYWATSAQDSQQKTAGLSDEIDSLLGRMDQLRKKQLSEAITKQTDAIANLKEQIKDVRFDRITQYDSVGDYLDGVVSAGKRLLSSTEENRAAERKANAERSKAYSELSQQLQKAEDDLQKLKDALAGVDSEGNTVTTTTTQLDRATQSLIDKLQDQYAAVTLNKQQLEQYNSEKIKAAIASSNLSDQQKIEAELLVDEIQRRKQAKDALLQQKAAAEEYAAIQRKLAVFQERQNLSITGMGMGEKWRQQQEQELQIRQQTKDAVLKLQRDQQSESTRISQEAYQQRLANIQYEESRQIEIMRQAALQKAAAEQSWITGSREALQNYADSAANIYQNVQNATANVLSETTSAISSNLYELASGTQSIGDSLQNMAKGFASSMLQALSDIAAQWLVYQAVQLLVGKTTQTMAGQGMVANALATQQMAALNAYSSTAAIPVYGPAAAPAAAMAAIAATTPFVTMISSSAFAGMFDNGGSIPSNKWGIVGEYGPEIVSGANVTSRQTTADILKQAAGGGKGDVYISVNIDAESGETTVSGDPQADYKQLGVMIGNAVRKIIIEEQRPMGLLDKNR